VCHRSQSAAGKGAVHHEGPEDTEALSIVRLSFPSSGLCFAPCRLSVSLGSIHLQERVSRQGVMQRSHFVAERIEQLLAWAARIRPCIARNPGRHTAQRRLYRCLCLHFRLVCDRFSQEGGSSGGDGGSSVLWAWMPYRPRLTSAEQLGNPLLF